MCKLYKIISFLFMYLSCLWSMLIFFLSFYTLQKFVSQVVKSTISDDCEIVGQSHQLGYTPTKRNLVEEFDEVAVPDSTLKLKAVKVEID